MFVYGSRHLFAPRRPTLRDQSRQSPGSVSGPTSSGSFALTLIRGPLQRAILGPVQLARRPASHPPDQRQGSAVTYVALCVVSAIAVKKRFFNYRATLRVACRSGRSASSLWRSASQRFCKVSDVCLRLKAPSRLSAPYFEGPKQAKSRLRFRPDFVGFLRREYYYSEFPNSEITITRFIAPTKE